MALESHKAQLGKRSYRLPSSTLTYWGLDKMDAIFQMTFSNGFLCMKMHEIQSKFHQSLFLGVRWTIFQHWFRQWLGTNQATIHYMNQWWPWLSWHLISTATQMFVDALIQVNNKEIIKAPHYRHFVKGIHQWCWFLFQSKALSCHDITISNIHTMNTRFSWDMVRAKFIVERGIRFYMIHMVYLSLKIT